MNEDRDPRLNEPGKYIGQIRIARVAREKVGHIGVLQQWSGSAWEDVPMLGVRVIGDALPGVKKSWEK